MRLLFSHNINVYTHILKHIDEQKKGDPGQLCLERKGKR